MLTVFKCVFLSEILIRKLFIINLTDIILCINPKINIVLSRGFLQSRVRDCAVRDARLQEVTETVIDER